MYVCVLVCMCWYVDACVYVVCVCGVCMCVGVYVYVCDRYVKLKEIHRRYCPVGIYFSQELRRARTDTSAVG